MQQVVAQLPEEQRIVVVLRYTEGLSYEEIADLLGCPRAPCVAIEPRPEGAGAAFIRSSTNQIKHISQE